MKSFIENMVEWWWSQKEKEDQELHPEVQKTYTTMLENSVYVSAIFALIIWGANLPEYIFSLSEKNLETTKQEVTVPTKQHIHNVLHDSIVDQEDWKQEWEQQGLSPQEIEESLQTGE